MRSGDALPRVLQDFETVVLLKPSTDLPRLRAAVADAGATATWVERVGRGEERVVRDLAALSDTRPDYFSLVIVRAGRTTNADRTRSKEAAHS
jgi:precorrin-2 methylase